MATVTVDAATDVPLALDPRHGHNRWHWDLEPVAHCRSGDELLIGTRDALDGQLHRGSSAADVTAVDVGRLHPLTGPISVDGAEPGDLLELEILEVIPSVYGFTSQRAGLGILAADFTEPYLVHWDLQDGWANSDALPGVRVAADPFLGIIGVAPSTEVIAAVLEREATSSSPPTSPRSAVPSTPRVASEGLRTGPPREFGGNVDLKDLVVGARLFLRVLRPGALLSVGDAHFAQGDGESCGTAIEMRSVARIRPHVHRASGGRIVAPWFEHPPRRAQTGPCISTLGYPPPVGPDRLLGAARSALRQLVEQISDAYGFDPQAAYALCSVAADLRIPQAVNEPNVAVTATISLDVFDDEGQRLRVAASRIDERRERS